MPTRLRGIVVAVVALGVCTPTIPLADPTTMPVASLPKDPPDVYSALMWRGPSKMASGYWYTFEQVQKIDRRITFLEEKAAKECVAAQIAEAKRLNPWIKIAAGIVTGAAIGYCVGADHHCGIVRDSK
jgi:hypothetical protein